MTLPDNYWPMVLLLGAGTFLIRFSFLSVLGRVRRTDTLTRLLKPIPSAVLAALVAPAILIPQGAQIPTLPNDRLLPGLIAGLVAWKSKNILLTIAAGMAALWVEQWVRVQLFR